MQEVHPVIRKSDSYACAIAAQRAKLRQPYLVSRKKRRRIAVETAGDLRDRYLNTNLFENEIRKFEAFQRLD